MVEKVWLKSYPQGMPAEIDPEAYKSIGEILEESCRKFPKHRAFTNMGTSYTYEELDGLSRDFAAYLQQGLKLPKGSRVALMMPNLLQYPVALFGALRAGMIVVNVNPLYTARELKHQLVDSGAEAIVIVENFAHTLQQVIGETKVRHVMVTGIGDMHSAPKSWLVNTVIRHVKKMVPAWDLPGHRRFKAVLAEGSRQTFEPVEVVPDDIAFLQYTGGTTGLAKGAILTHRNMVANLEQASAWLKQATEEGKEVIITALPLYHIFSLMANCLTFMKIGAENVLITNPRDMPAFVKELGNTPFTAITGVNTLFNGLLNAQGFTDLDFSTLKLTLGGGMAVQKAVAERWQKVTGVTLIEAYGLTETSPAACINPLTLDHYNGSIGLPIPSTEVSIRNENGEEVAFGETGELCIRGPQVTQGYWQRPEETDNAFFEGGWFRTGDMGYMDETGYVFIVDRKKDMILVSGFNVYPNEVEAFIAEHPKVVEVAVIGVPDEQHGEIVKAFVVPRDESCTAEEIIEHCREGLTRYKVPKNVEFRKELPKTNVGKILRRKLREEETAGQQTKAA